MKIKYFLKPALWIIVVAFLSLLPGDDLPQDSFLSRIPHFDKLVHAGMYFFLCIFLISPFEKLRVGKGYITSFVVSVILGGLFEILQITITRNRSGNIPDLIADAVGALLALLFFSLFVSGKRMEVIFRA